jgi:hypothetical protein
MKSLDMTFWRMSADEEQEIALTVHFHVTAEGCPPTVDYVWGGDPGWNPEVDIDEVWDPHGREVSSMLTREEWDRLYEQAFEEI